MQINQEEGRLIKKIIGSNPALFIKVEETTMSSRLKKLMKENNLKFIGEVVCYLPSRCWEWGIGFGQRSIKEIEEYLKQFKLALDNPFYTEIIDEDYNYITDDILNKAEYVKNNIHQYQVSLNL